MGVGVSWRYNRQQAFLEASIMDYGIFTIHLLAFALQSLKFRPCSLCRYLG